MFTDSHFFRLCLIYVCSSTVPTGSMTNTCPNGWIRYENSCYYVHGSDTYTWSEATHICDSHNAHLPYIESAGEENFIKDLLQKYFPNFNQYACHNYDSTDLSNIQQLGDKGGCEARRPGYFFSMGDDIAAPGCSGCWCCKPTVGVWLGATDEVVEGEWRWYKIEQTLDYTDWYPGQPDSMHSAREDCLLLLGTHDFKWHDGDCHSELYFMCELSPSLDPDVVIG